MTSSALRYPASVLSLTCLIVLSLFFWGSGILFPSEIPSYARSSWQITGMALMLILVPSYVAGATVVMQRRSLALVDQLRGELADAALADAAMKSIRSALRRTWPWGCLVGVVMGILNVDVVHVLTKSTTPRIDMGIGAGQILLWLSIGLNVGMRVIVAREFSRLGEHVRFSIFHLDRLRPLARSGLIDVVTIAVGMTLTPLQSLDAEFRWANYQFPLMTLVPAAIFLFLWPMRSIHRRIRVEKERQLEHADRLAAAMSGAQTASEVSELETLLAHRERIRELRTWPLDMAMLSRFAFYVVIPPLAWIGAALVEMIVNRAVGS